MLSTRILNLGSDGVPDAPIPLRAGPLTMLFEPETCFLRYVRLGDREILRGVYAAVRDRNWGTVPARVSDLRVERGSDSFLLTFRADCREREIDFSWAGTLAGEPNGTVRFTMDGEARSIFLRARIGFCVLHPVRECAGQPCDVEHPDGSLESSAFPQFIAPWQPFFDIRAMGHEVWPGLTATVRFEGDVWETEDQRNWTDASFKTYCTPLRIPYPVEVRAGERVRQSVTLTIQGSLPPPKDDRDTAVGVTLAGVPPVSLPEIGLGIASHGKPLDGSEIARLKALNPAHLRVDLRLGAQGWPADLRRAAAEAGALGVKLELALFLPEGSPERASEALQRLRSELDALRPPVARWLVFQEGEKSTTEQPVRMARAELEGYDPAVPFAAGTDAYFTELNRGRPAAGAAQRVTYSINPQIHAADNRSLVENLEAQAFTVESARQFCGDLPLVISSVTLRARYNPNATGPEPEPLPGELPPQVDPRQLSLFGACWTLGSLKYLAEGGVQSATYYETTGWRGVMEPAEGSPLPERFPSIPGAVFPLYHVLADVGEFRGGEVLPSRSGDPLVVESLVLRSGSRLRVLLANMGDEPRQVRLELPGTSGSARIRRLDAENAERAMRSPEACREEAADEIAFAGGTASVTLPPYGLVRLDLEAGGAEGGA